MSRKRLTSIERMNVYQKYNGHCAYCGKTLELKDMQVDHLIPLANGGADDFSNYMPSCRRCNHYKRASSLNGYRKLIEDIPKKLMRDSYIYRVGLDYGLVEVNQKEIKFFFEQVGEQE